jgi:hypothetical protein
MASIRTISNEGGAFGQNGSGAAIPGNDQLLIEVVNGAAVALVHGDVVVWKTPFDGCTVTTTTTANDRLLAGVVSATGDSSTDATSYAVGAQLRICVKGVARVNVGATAPAANDCLTTHTTAKQGTTNAVAPTANNVLGSFVGNALLATKDANNCLLAKITIS